MSEVQVGDHVVGTGHPCFITAEAGVNHNGSLELARQLVDVAVQAGADAVKFQTFIAEKVMTVDAPKAAYQKETTGTNESQLQMAKQFELSFHDFRQIKAYCDSRGILFLSTPFDEDSADFLDQLGVPSFKIPSGEVVNHPFLAHIARKGRPMIMSTGMCYLGEVDEAVQVIYQAGNRQLALLHCVSNYPANPADINLRAMQTMAAAFRVPIGYSDHTLGIEIALAAVALGASIIEKHFTLDRNLPGPDHRASLEPEELHALVEGIRTVERALGDGRKAPALAEENTRQIARRSLVLRRHVREAELIEPTMLSALRPMGGIPPNLIGLVVGRRAARALKAGTMLTWQDLR